MRKTLAILGVLAALLFTGATAAQAQYIENDAATLDLYVYQGNHYEGFMTDNSPDGGCVSIQAKINGVYTSDGWSGGGKTHCYGDGISTPTAAIGSTAYVFSNATAIRAYENGGSHRTLYICINRTDCQHIAP